MGSEKNAFRISFFGGPALGGAVDDKSLEEIEQEFAGKKLKSPRQDIRRRPSDRSTHEFIPAFKHRPRVGWRQIVMNALRRWQHITPQTENQAIAQWAFVLRLLDDEDAIISLCSLCNVSYSYVLGSTQIRCWLEAACTALLVWHGAACQLHSHSCGCAINISININNIGPTPSFTT